MLAIGSPRAASGTARASSTCWRHCTKIVPSSLRKSARQGARARAGVALPTRRAWHGATVPRSSLRRGGAAASPRQVDAEAHRRGPAQLVEQKRAEPSFARQRFAPTGCVGVSGVVRAGAPGPAAGSRPQDPALAPVRRPRLPSAPARSATARLVQVEGEQVGILDHRHRVLDAGRDPERARRRHDVAAVRRGDADTPVDDSAICPQGCACGTTRVSARRRSSLARNGRCGGRRETDAASAADAGGCAGRFIGGSR